MGTLTKEPIMSDTQEFTGADLKQAQKLVDQIEWRTQTEGVRKALQHLFNLPDINAAKKDFLYDIAIQSPRDQERVMHYERVLDRHIRNWCPVEVIKRLHETLFNSPRGEWYHNIDFEINTDRDTEHFYKMADEAIVAKIRKKIMWKIKNENTKKSLDDLIEKYIDAYWYLWRPEKEMVVVFLQKVEKLIKGGRLVDVDMRTSNELQIFLQNSIETPHFHI